MQKLKKFNLLRLLYLGLLSCLVLLIARENVLAHAGPHEGECEILVGEETLALQGFQPQSGLSGKHYCRIYPELGKLKFQLELLDSATKPQQVQIKLLAMASLAELITDPFDVFNQLVSERLGQVDDEGKIFYNTEINDRGFYSLEIVLQNKDGRQVSNRFMFLVGVPTAKILIGFCGLLVLYLIFTAIKPSIKPEVID